MGSSIRLFSLTFLPIIRNDKVPHVHKFNLQEHMWENEADVAIVACWQPDGK